MLLKKKFIAKQQWNAFKKLYDEQKVEFDRQWKGELLKMEEIRKAEKLELEKTRKLLEAQRRQFQEEVFVMFFLLLLFLVRGLPLVIVVIFSERDFS